MTKYTKKHNKGFKTSQMNPTAKTTTQPIKSGKQNTDAIIMQVAKAYKDRSRKDIQSWRLSLMAIDHIDTPRYTRYFDLIDDLKTDGTFKTQVLLRKASTLSINFQIRNRKTGALNDLATELFQQKWFYKYLGIELDSIIFGTHVVEFLEFNGHAIKFVVVPQRNTVPNQKRIYPDLSKANTFISYNEDAYKPWVIELNPDNHLGLINNIIPNLIWKRNVSQSWAEFCEKFGMPLISATTNNNNTTHIDNVEKQLLALAEASVGVFPEGTTIKFDEANRTDAYNVYSKFIEQNTKEISGVIVGSTTLTEEASNRSQSEVHERSLDFKISQADRRDISFTVNDELIPMLQAQGYNYISDDDVFEWEDGKESIDLNELWTVVNGIMQEYEVEQEWIEKTFSIPLVGKKKSYNPTLTTEDEEEVTALFQLPKYPQATCCPVHHYPTALGSSKILNALSKKLMYAIFNKKDTLGIEGQIIAEEALQLVNGLKSGYGVTTAYNTPDSLALQLMEYNLFEFSASKTEARLAAMSDLLIDKDSKAIRSYSDFKNLAEKEAEDFNDNWLRTEYNLSVAVGQNSAAYQRFLKEKDDFPFVEYQTMGDSNVRSAHAALNGKVFSMSDPEAMKLWPPNGYGCRCEFLQTNQKPKNVSKGKIAQQLLDGEKGSWSKSQFNINRGDLKQVFTKKQFYSDTKGLPDKLNKMTFDKYNLKPHDTFKSNLNPIKLDRSITKDNVKELFKKDKTGAFMGFKDYFNRKLILTEKNFNKHTNGYYLKETENRHQLFPHVKDLLNKPDEVWHKNPGKKIYNKLQTRYIKFYGDTILVADCEVKNTSLEIMTWYTSKIEEKDLRKGVLIKKGKDL